MNKKVIIILVAYALILGCISAGTFAYLNWQTASSQNTVVEFTVDGDYSCLVDVGGSINPSNVALAPTTCTNSTHAIKRTMVVDIDILGALGPYMDLWLDVESIDSALASTSNFKYALTTDPNSCTNGVVTSGTFNGKKANDKINFFVKKHYTQSITETYYLYIWLDAAETNTATMNKSFSLLIDGDCKNTNID